MAVVEPRERGDIESLRVTSQRPSTKRRRWLILAIVIIAAAGGVVLWYARAGTDVEPVTEQPSDEVDFAEVVVTDLFETSEYDGTLGRLEGESVAVRLEGTITALPAEGTTLQQGDVVAWIDNLPVILLYGDLPAWRTMANDVEGPDVLQLETALTELGYNEDEAQMTVDEEYTSYTENVVEDWQETIGADDDGVVDIGEVVFLPGPIRVDSLEVKVGDQVTPGSVVFTTSSDDIEVSFDLPTIQQGEVEVGAPAEITLPDLSMTTGVVTEVATVATSSEDGSDASFEVTVELDDTSTAGGIDEAPVTVSVITDRVDDVVAVPIEALLALAEGGYAVEVADGSDTRLVAVEPGFYADGLIEVTGEISAGDQVVVP